MLWAESWKPLKRRYRALSPRQRSRPPLPVRSDPTTNSEPWAVVAVVEPPATQRPVASASALGRTRHSDHHSTGLQPVALGFRVSHPWSTTPPTLRLTPHLAFRGFAEQNSRPLTRPGERSLDCA